MTTAGARRRFILCAALILLAAAALAVGQAEGMRSFVAVFWLLGAALAVTAFAVAIGAYRHGRRPQRSPRDR